MDFGVLFFLLPEPGHDRKVFQRCRIADRRDARGKVALPGLINTHHHLPQTLTRNLPSVQEAPLFRWLVELYEWQHNNVFLAISMPFLMGTHLAWAIESWRARHGAYIRQWLAAVGP